LTAYLDLLMLMNQAQNDYAQLTDLTDRLQQTPSFSYDFKVSRQGFQVNMGVLRPIGRGLNSTWTSGVGWDPGLSSQYGNECIIYRQFVTPLVVNQFVLNWENVQGPSKIVVEGRYQGDLLFQVVHNFTSTSPPTGQWTQSISPAKTIDMLALFSSYTNPPQHVTMTYLSLT
jgi:hypothetical protein